MFFDENRWLLTPEEIRYYRRVLVIHGDDPRTGVCPVCQVSGCPDLRGARDKLDRADRLDAGDRLDGPDQGGAGPGRADTRHGRGGEERGRGWARRSI